MPRAKINGRLHEFKDGITILQALRRVGLEVSTLCHDERLTNPYRDAYTLTPEYKVTAVRVERV
jgi:predicted molibdopterin-dependent oxidoreductase YjgC